MRVMHTYGNFYGIALSLLILIASLTEMAIAQEKSGYLPEISGESLVLGCDSEIYGAGEYIYFRAGYKGPPVKDMASWSTVLYVELIQWNGNKLAASKVLLSEGGFQGKVAIPRDIPSGVYYLRAYTLWMRNYAPQTYTYLPLRVLNPYSQEILAGPTQESASKEPMERKAVQASDRILFSGLKEEYGTGEKVEFEIQLEDPSVSGIYSLGISKTLGQSSSDYIQHPYTEAEKEADAEAGHLEFLPEINGLTISGTIVDAKNSESVKDARLQLSSYADAFLYAEVSSGADGSFLFSLPRFTGNPELHIAEASEFQSVNHIRLSSEYCNKPVHLPFVPLSIDSTEQAVVKEILINAQLKDRYEEKPLQAYNSEAPFPSFYGNNATVTYVSDYIELSDLREFIYEIIPQVSIQNNDLGSFISIHGPSCLDIYPPLVLMDNIPVPNNDELLNIPSNRIERIEVLNQAYMVGNTRYSGILSLYSGKKDMSGVAQGEDRHFFNFMMPERVDAGSLSGPEQRVSHLPFIGNLLHWEPRISLSGAEAHRVKFTSPDTPGSYVLTLRGSDAENKALVLGTALISVE